MEMVDNTLETGSLPMGEGPATLKDPGSLRSRVSERREVTTYIDLVSVNPLVAMPGRNKAN